MFAIATTALCIGVLLTHQANVSDHVLWMGALVIVVLLTLLIPAEEGGRQGRLLLVAQATVWVGLGTIAVLRHSPAIAGVAVLAPYLWLLAFATNLEQRLVNADLVPIVLSEVDLGLWMVLLVVQQMAVNHRLGDANLNLAGGLAGFSEMSSRLRDSEMLTLWNLGFVLACLTFVATTRPDGVTALGALGGMTALLLAHAGMTWLGLHRGRPQTLVIVWSISALSISWNYGLEAGWAAALTAGSAVLIAAAARRVDVMEATQGDPTVRTLPGRLLTVHLGMMTALFLVVALGPQRTASLTGTSAITNVLSLDVLSVMAAVSLVVYMQRLRIVDALLPTLAAIGLLVSMALAGQSVESDTMQLSALVMFVLVGAYLAFQGDVRSGLRALATKEEREASFAAKRERMQTLVSSVSADGSTTVGLRELDAELRTRSASETPRQAKRYGRPRRRYRGRHPLQTGRVVVVPCCRVHRVDVVCLRHAVRLLALLFSAGFAVVLVGLARLRANAIGLRLPDVAGVELPIAVAMVGMVLVHVAGRMTTGVLTESTVHLAALSLTLVLLVGMGLIGRNDLGLRIPSALEALLGLMVIDRMVCVLIGGEVPLPLATDPTALVLTTGALPLFGIETLLLGMVLLFDWVEGERLRRGLDDHRTAMGRSGWVAGTVALSLGPVSALALVFGLRRSLGWKQPAVAMTVVLLAPFAVQALVAWALAPASSILTPTNVAAAFGAVSVAWVAVVVARQEGLWLSAALWSAHGLLLSSAVLSASLVGLSFVALVVSSTAWVSGILTQRKSWRIVGAADLVVAWMVAAVALVAGIGASYVLMLLVASAALLFAVTTLTQANEAALMDD